MDSRYFKLTRMATEIAGLSNDLVMNANRREDVDQDTLIHLQSYLELMEHTRSVMFLAVSRQMKNDPQERDIEIF